MKIALGIALFSPQHQRRRLRVKVVYHRYPHVGLSALLLLLEVLLLLMLLPPTPRRRVRGRGRRGRRQPLQALEDGELAAVAGEGRGGAHPAPVSPSSSASPGVVSAAWHLENSQAHRWAPVYVRTVSHVRAFIPLPGVELPRHDTVAGGGGTWWQWRGEMEKLGSAGERWFALA